MLLTVLCVGSALAEDSEVELVRDLMQREMYRTAKPRLDALLEAQAAKPGTADPEVWATLAEYRLVKGDAVGGSEAARKAVELEPGSTRLWTLWGRTCMEAGFALSADGKESAVTVPWFRSAEQAFRKVRELDPKDSDAWWRLGQAMEWQGKHGVAEQFYENAIDESPDRPGGYCRLVRFLFLKDRKEEAKAAFDRGIRECREDAEILFTLADLIEDERDLEGALALYLRAIRADPDFKRAWDRAAKLCSTAEVLYPLAREVLVNHPTAANAAWWAGHHANRREPARGEKRWARNVEALGHVLPPLRIYGEHEGLYTEAFAAAQILFGDDPGKAPAPKPGIDAFRKIHEAWPWSGDAANNLGYYYREAKKYELSIEWYLKAVERAPENQDILNDTGLIYLFHFPRRKAEGLPYFLKTVALVREGDQAPERGYWDALENLCKHYWEVDRQPERVIEYARMRYVTTKGVAPYNRSPRARRHAEKARKALGR